MTDRVCTLDYGISVRAGKTCLVELLVRLINVPPGKLPFKAKKTVFFAANDTFLITKVLIFNRLINIHYEIRSMPAGKVPVN